MPVSRDQAIAAAEAQLGSLDQSVQVLRGRASKYMDDEIREVWIVVVDGGVSPFGGPPGAEPVRYDLTGVIIDAKSGEFLRGFMT
jgi:hypothetical protein